MSYHISESYILTTSIYVITAVSTDIDLDSWYYAVPPLLFPLVLPLVNFLTKKNHSTQRKRKRKEKEEEEKTARDHINIQIMQMLYFHLFLRNSDLEAQVHISFFLALGKTPLRKFLIAG